ncbi:hypothetical protein E2C01_097859 [Portunus trituberculatus]|uniref:Uncharacterized protein n=1 Tax=Portunus trituberculatus TaxID=210409 RepID=A0A5B7K6S5_PORTR|nr:hypothetical protein [Portunus trituberculatus]
MQREINPQPFCLCYPVFYQRENEFWRFTANMASTTARGDTSLGKDNGGGDKDENGRGKRVEKRELQPLYHVLLDLFIVYWSVLYMCYNM